jgi:hypothetical protein
MKKLVGECSTPMGKEEKACRRMIFSYGKG